MAQASLFHLGAGTGYNTVLVSFQGANITGVGTPHPGDQHHRRQFRRHGAVHQRAASPRTCGTISTPYTMSVSNVIVQPLPEQLIH